MASMINNKMISDTHFVESLTITFMPRTDEREVIGRVIAAMTRHLHHRSVVQHLPHRPHPLLCHPQLRHDVVEFHLRGAAARVPCEHNPQPPRCG